MRLYHATPRQNLWSIKAEGLNPAFTTGKRQAIWLHTESKMEWAILHTAKRKSVNYDDVIIIAVDIPRRKLTRRWRGLWTIDQTIPITDYTPIIEASTIASDSPIKEI